MKCKISLFNVIFLICTAGLIPSNTTPADDHLPNGVIERFNQGASVYTVAFSPDGNLIASGGDDNAVILWDVSRRSDIRTLIGHDDWVRSVAFSPDGRLLASVAMDGSLKLWDVSSGINVTSRKQSDRMEAVAFSLNGEMFATCGHIDGFIDLWSLSKKRISHTNRISGHRSAVSSISFSPDGLMLASAGDDDTVKLWNVADRSEIKSIAEHSSDVRSIAFAPDGKMLASGSKDNTIKLLEIPSGNALATLEHDYVESIAFSPDGQTLASAGADHTVKLWSTASRSELASLRGHHSGVTSVVFSPDGQLLASGSRDRTVLLWDLSYFNIESAPITKLAKKQKVLEVEESEDPPTTILTEETEATVSETESSRLRPDTTPPTISLNRSITDGMRVDTHRFTVQGKVTDDNGVDEIRVNGRKARVLENGVFTAAIQLSKGENSIRVTAGDTSGNIDTNQFIIVRGSKRESPIPRSDLIPPTITIISPPERVWHVTTDWFTVQGSVTDDDGINEVRVNDIEAEISEGNIFTGTVPLVYGENSIRVVARDTSGNMDTNEFIIRRENPPPLLDTTGPDIRILYPVASVTRGVKAKIYTTEAFTRVSGTVTDTSGVAEVEVNGTEVQVTGDNFDTTVPLNYGDNQIGVTATDTRGNEAKKKIIVFREDYRRKGKDYALLFAVETYTHWNNLGNPVFDATAIQQDLKDIYGFQTELVHNPTRSGYSLLPLREYAQKAVYTEEDQLFIFLCWTWATLIGRSKHGLPCRSRHKECLKIDTEKMQLPLPFSVSRNIIDRMSCKHILSGDGYLL